MEAAEDIRQTIGNRHTLSIKERNHRAEFLAQPKNSMDFVIHNIQVKHGHGNESRAYLRVHDQSKKLAKILEAETRRLEYSLIFGFFKKNKKGIHY